MSRALVPIGTDLPRPLATHRGDLYTSDSRGGVMHIRPDDSQVLLTGRTAELPGGITPNGIALQADGSFLLAHLGTEDGGVFTLHHDGKLAPLLREADRRPAAAADQLRDA